MNSYFYPPPPPRRRARAPSLRAAFYLASPVVASPPLRRRFLACAPPTERHSGDFTSNTIMYLYEMPTLCRGGGSALSLGSRASRTFALDAMALARAQFTATKSALQSSTKRAAMHQI